MIKALADSNYLYALSDQSDDWHEQAAHFAEQNTNIEIIVPDVVLTEVCYLLKKRGGLQAMTSFLEAISALQLPLQNLEYSDINRAREVLLQYPNLKKLEFVDCCIVALAERLNITRICTFDQRDFRVIRPKHARSFDLVLFT
jgi:uncharacterized protein